MDQPKPVKSKDGIDTTPRRNVEIALRNRPDILIISDCAVKKFKKSDYKGKELQLKIDQDKEFQKMLPVNTGLWVETNDLLKGHATNICLYVVFQGYSRKHMEQFFESISSMPFDGVSMPTRNQTLGQTALFLVQLWKMGIKNIHFLGVAALFPMALAAYMARHFFEVVTMDASSWKDKAFQSGYANPHNLGPVYVGENVVIDPHIQLDCSCSACKGRSFSYYQNLPYTYRRILLCHHNFQTMENMGQELLKNATSINSLINFLRTKTNRVKEIEELYTVLSLVEAFKNEDLLLLEAILT